MFGAEFVFCQRAYSGSQILGGKARALTSRAIFLIGGLRTPTGRIEIFSLYADNQPSSAPEQLFPRDMLRSTAPTSAVALTTMLVEAYSCYDLTRSKDRKQSLENVERFAAHGRVAHVSNKQVQSRDLPSYHEVIFYRRGSAHDGLANDAQPGDLQTTGSSLRPNVFPNMQVVICLCK